MSAIKPTILNKDIKELLEAASEVLFIAKPWSILPEGTQGRNAYDRLNAIVSKLQQEGSR
jgi:hypothetical protein